MKRYTSFDEIDRDLKFLKLKNEIDKEELKLSINTSKENVKDAFSPITFITSTIGAVLQKAFVLKMVDKLFGLTKVKKVDTIKD